MGAWILNVGRVDVRVKPVDHQFGHSLETGEVALSVPYVIELREEDVGLDFLDAAKFGAVDLAENTGEFIEL